MLSPLTSSNPISSHHLISHHTVSSNFVYDTNAGKVYEGEVTELTPEETENPLGGYGRTVSHVVIGLKTTRGGKQLR